MSLTPPSAAATPQRTPEPSMAASPNVPHRSSSQDKTSDGHKPASDVASVQEALRIAIKHWEGTPFALCSEKIGVGLTQIQHQLDQQGIAIVQHQKDTAAAKRQLADSTRGRPL